MKIDFLEEPELEFGTGHHVDVRFGLMNYGPFDFQSPVSPRKLNVGVIGTPETIEGACGWLEKCRDGFPARKSNQPNLFPKFPGFRDDNLLQTTLVLDEKLQFSILQREFDRLGSFSDARAVEGAVDLFLRELESMAEKKAAHVAVCAIPMSLIKQKRKGGGPDAEPDDVAQFGVDFHHLLKARAMAIGVPIQLVLPMTYDSPSGSPRGGARCACVLCKMMPPERGIYMLLSTTKLVGCLGD